MLAEVSSLTSAAEVPSAQALQYAQDLALLRGEGRGLRRRIEEQEARLQTVLIVDDEPLMRALIAATLSPESYDMVEATDGDEAIHLVNERHPTLVILDQRMPGRDGFSVCQAIKSDPDLRDIRVVMLTANPADEPRAVAMGANAYLCKPFSPKQLLQTIEGLMRPA